MTERIDLDLKDSTASCSCCASPTSAGAAVAATATAATADILVSGMTCLHCVSSITEELTGIDGVQTVTVELNAGGTSRVTILSASPLDAVLVKAAVEEAGYALADSPV